MVKIISINNQSPNLYDLSSLHFYDEKSATKVVKKLLGEKFETLQLKKIWTK